MHLRNGIQSRGSKGHLDLMEDLCIGLGCRRQEAV